MPVVAAMPGRLSVPVEIRRFHQLAPFVRQNPINECNGDFSPTETIAPPDGGWNSFRFADDPVGISILRRQTVAT